MLGGGAWPEEICCLADFCQQEWHVTSWLVCASLASGWLDSGVGDAGTVTDFVTGGRVGLCVDMELMAGI